ncbi:hypothetical protein VS_1575 [Vibrio atlanticus]|uniref:Uncharacterized protein n=1 Tax=Vibrio atlanticus (strain LGP32) TaxID=575788 RepID=B7VP11_VIBA3|nr:hypothetical protein VS_1575 [Vibrio atlanticus]
MVGVERRTDQRRDVVDVLFRYQRALSLLESDQVIAVPDIATRDNVAPHGVYTRMLTQAKTY